ncbi:hypothetical protein M6B38_324690 [Iris pallida]|uniref:Uncharacterized protein n=1 Tax=Iris pallida TaxID=29817 RepID=A0AAX6H7A9_IRIPA|nr:hypothetical protein M6B38_324690 [Iris pallida]
MRSFCVATGSSLTIGKQILGSWWTDPDPSVSPCGFVIGSTNSRSRPITLGSIDEFRAILPRVVIVRFELSINYFPESS